MTITTEQLIALLPLLITGLTVVVVMLSIAWRRNHFVNATLTVIGLNIALVSLWFSGHSGGQTLPPCCGWMATRFFTVRWLSCPGLRPAPSLTPGLSLSKTTVTSSICWSPLLCWEVLYWRVPITWPHCLSVLNCSLCPCSVWWVTPSAIRDHWKRPSNILCCLPRLHLSCCSVLRWSTQGAGN